MNNYFLPNFKLVEKRRVDATIIKKHSTPATPYQRLMQSEHLTDAKKQELTSIYNQLNLDDQVFKFDRTNLFCDKELC